MFMTHSPPPYLPPPPNLSVEALTLNVVVLGGRAFGKWSGLGEVRRVGPMMGLVPLHEEEERLALSLLCEDSVRTGSCFKLGREALTGTQSVRRLDCGLPELQKCEKPICIV